RAERPRPRAHRRPALRPWAALPQCGTPGLRRLFLLVRRVAGGGAGVLRPGPAGAFRGGRREVLGWAGADDASLGEGAAQGVLAVGAGLLGREAVTPLVPHDGDLPARGTGSGSSRC